jgi:hypothetical protein
MDYISLIVTGFVSGVGSGASNLLIYEYFIKNALKKG